MASVARLRRQAATAELSEVLTVGPNLRLAGRSLADSRQMRLARLYRGSKYIAAMEASLIPLPDLDGDALLEWVSSVISTLFGED